MAELILALDADNLEEARGILTRVGPALDLVKIGPRLVRPGRNSVSG